MNRFALSTILASSALVSAVGSLALIAHQHGSSLAEKPKRDKAQKP